MKRVFLDANVLFTAAHNPRGKAALVFESSAARRWLLLTSSYAIAEARHNLGLKFPETLNTLDRKSTRLNSSHIQKSRMPSSA